MDPRRRQRTAWWGVVVGWLLVTSWPGHGAETNLVADGRSVFARPQLESQVRRLAFKLPLLFRGQQYEDAEKLARQLIQLLPQAPDGYYNLACIQAVRGHLDAARDSLAEAIALGYNDVARLRADPDLEALRADRHFPELLEQAAGATPSNPWPVARPVKPALVQNGVAWVGEENTAWEPRANVLQAYFEFPPAPGTNGTVILGAEEVETRLQAWAAAGSAAGNRGDLYDNRDRGHARLFAGRYPTLTRVAYREEARRWGYDFGLQSRLFFNAITVGNASVANTDGPLWRSMARLAYTDPSLMQLLHTQYVNNELYVYPAHHDHDADPGDVYCANTPYLLISQGSSGSDKPFLDALVMTLAAFRPETKQWLRQQRAIAPTLQMIFRASGNPVTNTDAYLTGVAHPTVFDAAFINRERMLVRAHALLPATVPPQVELRVVAEDEPRAGVDFFDATETEHIFDTASAIARVVRGMKYRRRMVVSAAGSHDSNHRPLTYQWCVLRGDPGRVEFKPRKSDRSEMELLVAYPTRAQLAVGYPIPSQRVDVGVFVQNGASWSAPAFISFYYLANETRVYDEQQRIQSVTYTGAAKRGPYVDPLLDRPKDWRDEYHYDAAGKLSGWTRHRGDQTEEFTAGGRLIVSRDDHGQPVETQAVSYQAAPRGDGTLVLQEIAAENRAHEDSTGR